MLGDAFYEVFNNDYILKCTDIDINSSWLSYLDFRNRDSYLKDVKQFNPDYLFHLGAYTDLEWCENHPNETYITNVKSVMDAVSIANELDIPILYISTAGIFDGSQDVYNDWDSPNPIGVYASSKYEGEKYVCRNANRYLVCRAGWMMGGGPTKDKKFVNKIVRQIQAGKHTLFIVDDKKGTPTYSYDFANMVKTLIRREEWGVYNCVCVGQTDRYSVAKEIVDILGVNDKVKVEKVSSDYYGDEYFAQRPKCECLINQKLNQMGINIMRDWRVCLKEYLHKYYK